MEEKSIDELPVRVANLLKTEGFENAEQIKIFLGKHPRKLLKLHGFGETAYKYVLEWLNCDKLRLAEEMHQYRNTAKKAANERWENLLLLHIKAHKLTGYKTQFRFNPDRRWTFDFAFTKEKLAIEIDGGLFIRGGGGHNSGKGYQKDREKDQAALLAGWLVYRVTPQMVRKGEAINHILALLKQRQTP